MPVFSVTVTRRARFDVVARNEEEALLFIQENPIGWESLLDDEETQEIELRPNPVPREDPQ